MALKYKVGQKVRILDTENMRYHWMWRKLVNKVCIITSVHPDFGDNGCYILNDNEFCINFQEDSLEPVKDEWDK